MKRWVWVLLVLAAAAWLARPPEQAPRTILVEVDGSRTEWKLKGRFYVGGPTPVPKEHGLHLLRTLQAARPGLRVEELGVTPEAFEKNRAKIDFPGVTYEDARAAAKSRAHHYASMATQRFSVSVDDFEAETDGDLRPLMLPWRVQGQFIWSPAVPAAIAPFAPSATVLESAYWTTEFWSDNDAWAETREHLYEEEGRILATFTGTHDFEILTARALGGGLHLELKPRSGYVDRIWWNTKDVTDWAVINELHRRCEKLVSNHGELVEPDAFISFTVFGRTPFLAEGFLSSYDAWDQRGLEGSPDFSVSVQKKDWSGQVIFNSQTGAYVDLLPLTVTIP